MSKRSKESRARVEFEESSDDAALQLAHESQRHLDRALRAEAALRRVQPTVAFAGRVLKEHRNEGLPDDVDGGWLQDTALELGLLDERKVYEPCSEETCVCAEVATEWPVTCFFLTEAGTAAIRAGEETQ
jgi:hypothetical protein